jgi:hypothetical protein
MIFGYFTFFVALVISAVAEFYSIIGLTSIFAAAYWPVVIMGVALGVGKITAAVWLKLHWNRASLAYKLYLVPAVAFLMFLTSMGIFGFLSKSHSDLSLVTGDKSAQLVIYDEKIKILNENTEANRKALKQLDAAVDQVMERSTTVQGAIRSVSVRRNQQQERKQLTDEIIANQQEIGKITEERSVIAAEVRQVEAEVGPIKYIAAVIYGNNHDSELLESAVRWVIILIVLVFDPLALCLLLAAQQSLRWAKEDATHIEKEKCIIKDTNVLRDTAQDNQNAIHTSNNKESESRLSPQNSQTSTNNNTLDSPINIDFIIKDSIIEDIVSSDALINPTNTNLNNTNHAHINTIELPPIKTFAEIKESMVTASATPPSIIDNKLTFSQPTLEQLEIINTVNTLENNTTQQDLDNKESKAEIAELTTTINIEKPIQSTKVVVPQPPEAVAPKAKEIVQVPETIDRGKQMQTELNPAADNVEVMKGTNVKAHFGITFPINPEKGELFLRVDYLPTRLFKFNGSKWIEVNKAMTDSYVYNTEYIKFMIKEIDAGRLDPDDISPSEREQITDFLANDEQTNNPP